MKNRRRFLVFEKLSPRNFQPDTNATASSEHARVNVGVSALSRGTSSSAHTRMTVEASHLPTTKAPSARARKAVATSPVSPAVISDNDDDSDALMDTFSLDDSRSGTSAGRDNVDFEGTREMSPNRYTDDPGHQLEPPSYEALRRDLIETKELLADVMGQQGEYETVIRKMAFKQTEQLVRMKAAHEKECVGLIDLVADIKKSCGNRLADMNKEHEEAKRAFVKEAEDLRQKMARAEGTFDLYVVNLKSNHEKHISDLRDALLEQEKEIKVLMEAQSSFAARLEAAQKEQQQQQNDHSEKFDCNDQSTECEDECSVEQVINKSAAEISQCEPAKKQEAVEDELLEISMEEEASPCKSVELTITSATEISQELATKLEEVEELGKQSSCTDEDDAEADSMCQIVSPRENEIHAKYGSFISELHMVHRRECLALEEQISEQENELKQLASVLQLKAMEQKSKDDLQAAIATISEDYNEMIACVNAANKEALRELNKQLIHKTTQIEELRAKHSDQKMVIKAAKRDLKEVVMKCEDDSRDHKSEAAALSHVISEIHIVHTQEVKDLRRQLALKDKRIEKVRCSPKCNTVIILNDLFTIHSFCLYFFEKLEKDSTYLDSSLTTMTKTLEAIAGKSSRQIVVPSAGQPAEQDDLHTIKA
mmetsp:Transcript_57801/g.172530  ORF Transcript_57801/g.172530 Transcript_57801/m.172530 type:complete len:654 (-) Transcript_57801:105-2066(-)